MKSKDLRYPTIADHTEILKQGVQDMLDAGRISQEQYNNTIDMLDELLAEQGVKPEAPVEGVNETTEGV